MKLYQIYFSPTGGTKKTADIITGVWQQEAEQIDLSEAAEDYSKYSFKEEDICIIAVPAFGGRVPTPAIERLACMKGGKARVIMLAVYGNRAYEDTLLELEDTLKESGFRCVAAIGAVAEHSIMRKYGSKRPDAQDKQQLTEFAGTIRRKLEQGEHGDFVNVPGNHPYREYAGVPMKPKAGKKCTKCGACAAACPVSAIPKEDPSGLDEAKCISCMRCMTVCPKQARTLNPVVLLAATKKLKKVCSERKENEMFL